MVREKSEASRVRRQAACRKSQRQSQRGARRALLKVRPARGRYGYGKGEPGSKHGNTGGNALNRRQGNTEDHTNAPLAGREARAANDRIVKARARQRTKDGEAVRWSLADNRGNDAPDRRRPSVCSRNRGSAASRPSGEGKRGARHICQKR